MISSLVSLPKRYVTVSRGSLDDIQKAMSDLMSDFFSEERLSGSFQGLPFPALEVTENAKGVTIKAELPGLSPEDVKIETHKNVLILKGEKKKEISEEDSQNYHVKEISYGSFSRTLSLPFEIDASQAKADFSKGVLTISLSKPEEKNEVTQTISIQSS